MRPKPMDAELTGLTTCVIWKNVTGGGSAADYLRWSAAKWTHFREATTTGLTMEAQLSAEMDGPELQAHLRTGFLSWLMDSYRGGRL